MGADVPSKLLPLELQALWSWPPHSVAMDVASLRRLTTDKDVDAIPSKQCWVDAAGQLWWDLGMLYDALLAKGMGITSRKLWMRRWRSVLGDSLCVSVVLVKGEVLVVCTFAPHWHCL